MIQGYEYRDVFASLLRYLGTIANRIAVNNPELPPLKVLYLDSITDFTKLPEGDHIFMADWTMQSSPIGDVHQVLFGFSAVNDINGSKIEEIYMNELLKDVAHKRVDAHTKIPIYSVKTLAVTGILVYSPEFSTNSPRYEDARSFRTVSVTLLSPQRIDKNQ